jgi:hypothetical protein
MAATVDGAGHGNQIGRLPSGKPATGRARARRGGMQGACGMNAKVIAVGLVLVSFLWAHLAFESWGRGNTGIAAVQLLAGIAFAGRGVVEWLKARR